MVDRIEHAKQVDCFVTIPLLGKCVDGPHSGVTILSAILAQTGGIALDVSGIARSLVKWRPKKPGDTLFGVDQMSLQRHHGCGGPRRVSYAREDRPGLSNGVNLAFLAALRAKPGTVIEGRAAIPGAIPGVALERLTHSSGVG